jgi:hypothetical protein
MSEGSDHLSKAEIGKDAIQAVAEAAVTTAGEVVTIIAGAVKDVATAVGSFATEVFEISDASKRALAEHDQETPDLDEPAG